MSYWQQNGEKFPLLAIAARKYLAIPSSSSPSEREFKQCKQITKDRITLKPANVEMLLFLKYNLRAIDYKLDNLIEVPEGFGYPNSRITPAPIIVEPEVENDDDLSDEDEADVGEAADSSVDSENE